MLTLLILCADVSRPSKVGAVNYSPEIQLEMLLEDIAIDPLLYKRSFFSSKAPHPCKWRGVQCDPAKRMRSIFWSGIAFNGSLFFRNIPSTVFMFYASNSKLLGSCNLRHLPDQLQVLELANNSLSGSVCLTELPAEISTLILENNEITGSIDLTQLPENFEFLNMKNNQLSGSVIFSALPPHIGRIDLSDNQLSGSIIFAEGADLSLRFLDLSNNHFTGKLKVPQIAADNAFSKYTFDDNAFEDEAVVVNEIFRGQGISLRRCGIKRVLDANDNPSRNYKIHLE